MQMLVNDRVMVSGFPDVDNEGQIEVFLDIDDARYFLRRVPEQETKDVVFHIAVALTGWVPGQRSVLVEHEKTVYR